MGRSQPRASWSVLVNNKVLKEVVRMKEQDKTIIGKLQLFTKQQAAKIKQKVVDARRKNEDIKREKENGDVARW